MNGASLLSIAIANLHAQSNGDLWIGYINGGMSVVRGGRLIHVAEQKTDSLVGGAFAIEMDVDGSLWAATGLGLVRFSAGKWERIGTDWGLPGSNAEYVMLDHYGQLWVDNDQSLYLLDRASRRFIDTGLRGGTDTIAPGPDGRLWRGKGTSWEVLPGAYLSNLKPSRSPMRSSLTSGMFDRDGNHWAIRCPVGTCRLAAKRFAKAKKIDLAESNTERFDQPWQMSSLAAHTMIEDREGNIWVGTQGGLERYRHNKFVPADLPPGEQYFHIARDEQGNVSAMSYPDGILFEPGTPLVGNKKYFNGIIGGGWDGSFYIADSRGVEIRREGSIDFINFPVGDDGKVVDNFPSILGGEADSLWVAIARRGMFHLTGGRWIPASNYGIKNGVRWATAAPEKVMWFAYRDGTVIKFNRGQLTTYEPAKKDSVGPMTFIDASHGVLLGGENGLAVLQNDVFHPLRSAEPDLLAGITGQVVTVDGDRWFNGRKGVVRITAQAWADALKDTDKLLNAETYDSLDGYPGSAQTEFLSPTAIQDAKGKLWFLGSGGIVRLDPQRIHRNTVAPVVTIRGLQVQGTQTDTAMSVSLPPGSENLRIDYSALSYTMPERVRFRYQLAGIDKGWQDVGTRRSAYYSALGPGKYHFRVTAVNEDGIASDVESEIRFEIRPAFTQTIWFALLCGTVFAVLLYALYRSRMRALGRRYAERMRERVAERERIARALHDTLLQNMQGIILRLQGVGKRMHQNSVDRISIEEILDQADLVMAEGRDEVQALRSEATPGDSLAISLANFGASLQEVFGTAFRIVETGSPRAIDISARYEIHAVGREAIFNAFQHAGASVIDVEIIYANDRLTLCIADDGAGIPAGVQMKRHREGHWGLAGMLERSVALGGVLVVRERAPSGSEIILTVPAKRAYPTPPQSNSLQVLTTLIPRLRNCDRFGGKP